jgi:hygromycin-B 4-O-kinase
MSFTKMNLQIDDVQDFLDRLSKQLVSNITPLSGGEWSQAFAFTLHGKDFVVRFGQNKDNYLIDMYAARYASEKLPIPRVLEVGNAFGAYFAISERAFGVLIDDLGKADMKRVIPSLFATMDAIRETDIAATSGFGQLNPSGANKLSSWQAVLLAVDEDIPERKEYGWKEGLRASPVGIQPFEEAYTALTALTDDLPEVRTLIHNDLLNFNVLVNDSHITAVFDWGNALCGDFLYELAMFVFWEPIYEPIRGIDWKSEALAHYKSIGLEVPEFERRLLCCMINLGLGSLVYYGYKQDWTYLEAVTKRTLQLARNGM